MSTVAISAAFETALDAMTPSLDIAYPSETFEPDGATPYQEVALVMAAPDDTEFGGGSPQERGFFQVSLMYPFGQGQGGALARADLIKATFPRGRTLVASGVIVTIQRTAEIAAGLRDGDRWRVPVRIRFTSP